MRDILALFRHPHSSNGPTEAINGRLETLRGNAMGFANTTSYIQRCLIHSRQNKDILTHYPEKSLIRDQNSDYTDQNGEHSARHPYASLTRAVPLSG